MTQAPVKEEAKEAKNYSLVAVTLPIDLAEQLEQRAAATTPAKIGAAVLARRLIAKEFDYDISAFEQSRRRGRVKFASEEEKRTAIRERAATVKALMARYEKGLLQVSADEIASAMAEMAKRKPRTRKTASK